MKYYLVVKKKEVLMHATVWGNLENTILSKRNQSQKMNILSYIHNCLCGVALVGFLPPFPIHTYPLPQHTHTHGRVNVVM